MSALGRHPAGADDGGGAAGDDAAGEADGLRAVGGVVAVVVAAEEVAEAEGRLDAVVVGGAGAECGEARWGRHAVGWGGGWFVGVGGGVGVGWRVVGVRVGGGGRGGGGGAGAGAGVGEGRVAPTETERQVVGAEGVFVLREEEWGRFRAAGGDTPVARRP